MTSFALFFTLSAVGISETVYLIRKRIASEKPICPIGEGCVTVLTSKYSKMFVIPNDVLGLLTYIIISFIAAFLVIGVEPMFLWIGILIFKNPEAWGGYLQPWAAGILPIPLKQAMISTAILDVAIGTLLLINSFVWLVALVVQFI